MNVRGLRLVVAGALAVAGCSSPVTPTQPTPVAPVPARFPDLVEMAGMYTLTIDVDDSCSAIPAAARHHVYRAVLEDRGWHFLILHVVGGGFAEPTQMGDVFSGQLNPFHSVDPQLRWNVEDIGVEGKAEPLTGGRKLVMTANGPIGRSASTLYGALAGNAYIAAGNTTVAHCQGTVHFLFERD